MKPHVCVDEGYTDDGCTAFSCGECRGIMEGRFDEPAYCMWCGVKFTRHVKYEEAVQNRWKRAMIDKNRTDPLDLCYCIKYYKTSRHDPLSLREEGYLIGCTVDKKTFEEEIWDDKLKHTGVKRTTIYTAWKDRSHTLGMACVRIVEMLSPKPEFVWDDEGAA